MDEEQLFFKRFPEEKQDQVRGLVEYATLMGLTGKDLVSIGGKLDRLVVSREIKRNKDIVAGFNCLPIYKDSDNSDTRFKLKTVNGYYKFEDVSVGWRVTSMSTKVVKTHNRNSDYKLPSSFTWSRRKKYGVLLDIAKGDLQLNF